MRLVLPCVMAATETHPKPKAVVSGTEVTQSYMETHAYGLAALLRLRQPPSPDDGTKYRIYMLVHLQMVSTFSNYGKTLSR